MKTYLHNPENKSTKWYIVDATNVPLGRLASQVAAVLRGKNKPEFTPSVDCGDHVIVINCDKVALTGKKMEQKYYRYHTLYVGGLKEIQYSTLLKDKSDFAVYEAVRGMLPKNRIGRKMIKKLRCYAGSEHGHEAQMPEVLNIEGKRA
ncbi:MAG: 50S ribosomal protein L13 [Clostridia bacterium]|nr:50S ribosomal protein L13 [Clostridia bacterium]